MGIEPRALLRLLFGWEVQVLFGVRSSRLLMTLRVVLAAAAVSASLVLYPAPAAAATEDAGECSVKAVLVVGPPALQGAATVQQNLPYAFDTTSSSCTSAFGSGLTWAGNGFVQEASCTSLVNLLGVSDAEAANQPYFGVVTSGAGTLFAQAWVLSTLNADLTAAGTFVPDTSVYANPAVPTQQCIGGGITTVYLTGVVLFQLRTIF